MPRLFPSGTYCLLIEEDSSFAVARVETQRRDAEGTIEYTEFDVDTGNQILELKSLDGQTFETSVECTALSVQTIIQDEVSLVKATFYTDDGTTLNLLLHPVT